MEKPSDDSFLKLLEPHLPFRVAAHLPRNRLADPPAAHPGNPPPRTSSMRSCVPPSPDSRTLRPIQRSFYLPGTMPGIREVVRRHVPTGLPSLPNGDAEACRADSDLVETWHFTSRKEMDHERADRPSGLCSRASLRNSSHQARVGSVKSGSSPRPVARRQMSLATMGSKLPGSSFRSVTPSESVKAPSLTTPTPKPSRTYARVVDQPPISGRCQAC